MAIKKTDSHSEGCSDCKETRLLLPSALVGGMVILAIIGIGILILQKVVPKEDATSLSTRQLDGLPSMPGVGFFTLLGTVTDINDGIITIRTISPVGDMNSEVFYQLKANDKTVVTHQAPKESLGTMPQFNKERGNVSDIHKGHFLSATTNDIISSVGVLNAVTIDYSEASPFVNINNKK